jgi:hypothetical protein
VYFSACLIVTPRVTGAATKAVSERFLEMKLTALTALKFAWGYVRNVAAHPACRGFDCVCRIDAVPCAGNTLDAFLFDRCAGPPCLRTPRIEVKSGSGRWELVSGNRGKVFAVVFVCRAGADSARGSGSLIIQLILWAGIS